MMAKAVAGGMLAVTALAAGPSAPAAELEPHRAYYAMSLHSTRPSSGIAAASGAMTYKFSDACDGWTVENRTALTFAYNEGAQVATTWEFVTWEAKDGLSYRFHVRSVRDGVVAEEIDGAATLDGHGMGGVARFTKPEAMTVKLPKGTMFPTEHTLRLIERAEAGERVYNRVVFDGSGTDGPFEVNALVGAKVAAGSVADDAAVALTKGPSWRFDMAFFPIAAQEAVPDYEVGLRYFANGVAKDVLQNFGDFSLRARLERLEPLPKPDC